MTIKKDVLTQVQDFNYAPILDVINIICGTQIVKLSLYIDPASFLHHIIAE